MITLKQNDTGIGILSTLSNENGPVDLLGATVLFYMGEHAISPTAQDEINGVLLVTFNSIHTVVTGLFKAEFEVKFSDGRVETFPNDGYLQVNIIKDLGGN